MLSRGQCHSRVRVYLLPEVQIRPPLERLQSVWNEIKNNIDRDLVIVMNKGYTKGLKRSESSCYKTIEFSQFSSIEAECRKFAAVIKILKVIIENLKQVKTTTKRDLYYQDVALFRNSQHFAYSMLDMISYSLGLSLENDLKIYASQKGLVFANMPVASCGIIQQLIEPVLIPRVDDFGCNVSFNFSLSDIPDCIVVVEKEAVFKSFCEYIQDHEIKMLVITGKGYPDHLTKKFLVAISQQHPQIPVLAFMDADVYGIRICKTYKFGEGLSSSVCPQMKLAGAYLLDYASGWLDISSRDWRMMCNFAQEIATTNVTAEKDQDELKKWHRELTRGLVLFKKSEINVVDTGASSYMVEKIKSAILVS